MAIESIRIGSTYAEYFATLSNKHRREIARWALDHRRHIDTDLRDELNDVISERVSVDGFRGKAAPNAPAEKIIPPLIRMAGQDDRTANAIFGVWWESNPELLDTVHETLGALARTKHEESPGEPSSEEFDTYLHEVAESVLANHPAYPEHHVHLMVFLAGRRIEGKYEDYIDQRLEDEADLIELAQSDEQLQTSPEAEQLFAQILRSLETLSADSPDWDAPIIRLRMEIDELRSRKVKERNAMRNIARRLAEFTEEYADLLTYFEWDPEQRLANRDGPWSDPVELEDELEVVSQDMKTLAQQHALEPPATANAADERDSRLAELRSAIRESLTAIEKLAIAPSDDAMHPVEAGAAAFDSERVQELITERDEYARQVENEQTQREAAEKTAKELAERNKSLQQANSRYERQNSELSEDVADLKDKIAKAQATGGDRKQLVTESAHALADVRIPRPDFPSVQDVVDRAKDALSEQLDFHPNTASIKALKKLNASFARPNEVAKNLEWLANTYFRNKKGDISVPDLAKSLYESTTWEYAPFQTDVTTGKYPSEYKTKVGEREIPLTEHIGKGADSAENTIRIAFAWDDESKKVLIGYIGKHQKTDRS